MDQVRSALQGLLASRPSSPDLRSAVSFCDMSLTAMATVARNALITHAAEFQWAMQPYTEYYYRMLVTDLWGARPVGSPDDADCLGVCEDFAVQAYGFMAETLTKSPPSPWGASFWTPDRMYVLFEAVVARGLILTPAELEEWEEDPEAYQLAQVRSSSLLCCVIVCLRACVCAHAHARARVCVSCCPVVVVQSVHSP